ncbi:YWFCY domain-containing protein [Flavitalea flava]
MRNGEDQQALRTIRDLTRLVSVILLLLHFYYICYGAFVKWGLTGKIPDRIFSSFVHTGLFERPIYAKGLCLVFLVLSLIGLAGRKNEKVTYCSVVLLTSAGLIVFLTSVHFLPGRSEELNQESLMEGAILYMLVTTVGYLGIMTGGARLSRILPLVFRTDDPFGRGKAGFPQEEQLRKTDFSLHLPAHYTYRGNERNSWINIINPRRGVFILGSPGCGKSYFIIEPLLRQLVEKGFALFLYDFKYDSLTRLAYTYFQTYRNRYPANSGFYSINFTDLSRSHRCNLLDPVTLDTVADAIGAARTILLSMNKTWIHQQGDFFVESPINFLGALIWFLRKYQEGRYCTLPHVIELAQVPYDKLFTILNAEPEISTLINPFINAFRNKNMELLNSQISSAKIPLGRLASPDLYYILTGNDLTLDINDPASPKILCLGGDPPRQEALAPILSLYIDRLNKRINRPGRYKCALVCDEFATVRAYSTTTTIATARSNNVVPILAVQDLSQLRTQYSREEADLFLNIAGNLFCGQVGGETARWISERFPKILQTKASFSANSSDTSISQSQQWEPTVSPATIANLSSGEFLGIVADDPGDKLEMKAFHGRLRRGRPIKGLLPLPVVRGVDAEILAETFLQVRDEVEGLVMVEIGRILNDPELMRFVVK